MPHSSSKVDINLQHCSKTSGLSKKTLSYLETTHVLIDVNSNVLYLLILGMPISIT